MIHESLKTTQSHQKSYVDVRWKELKFEVGAYAFLKVSPIKGIIMFGNKENLNPWFVGPYKIVTHDREVAYTLDLLSELAIVYLVSMFQY